MLSQSRLIALGLALSYAWWRDRLARRIPPCDPWLNDLRAHLRDPRLTVPEVVVRYAMRREALQAPLSRSLSCDEVADLYTSDYWLYRQLIHRRRASWATVLATMPRRRAGHLIEFGAGIAPVSAWVARRRPEWAYWLVDLPSPHRDFGLARLRRAGVAVTAVESLSECPEADVITAFDVLEHLRDPSAMAHDIVRHIRVGGVLHWNFTETDGIGLDLATPEARTTTIAYLNRELTPVWQRGEAIIAYREEKTE